MALSDRANMLDQIAAHFEQLGRLLRDKKFEEARAHPLFSREPDYRPFAVANTMRECAERIRARHSEIGG